MAFLGLKRQAHLLLAYLALIDKYVGDPVDAGAGPLAVGDLGIRTLPPEFDLLPCCVVTHQSVLLKRSAMDQLSSSTQPIVKYGCSPALRQYAIWTILSISAGQVVVLGTQPGEPDC